MALRKFEAANREGDVYVNPDDVSTVKEDGMTGGVRIILRSGKDDLVVKGKLKDIAKALDA